MFLTARNFESITLQYVSVIRMSKSTTQVRDILFDRQSITGITKDINMTNRAIPLTSDLFFSVSGYRDFRYHTEARENF